MGQIMAFDVLVQLHLDTVVGQSSWTQEEKAKVHTQFLLQRFETICQSTSVQLAAWCGG